MNQSRLTEQTVVGAPNFWMGNQPHSDHVESLVNEAIAHDFDERASRLARARSQFRQLVEDELEPQVLKAIKFKVYSLPMIWAHFELFGQEFSITKNEYGDDWKIGHSWFNKAEIPNGQLRKWVFLHAWRVSTSMTEMRAVREMMADPRHNPGLGISNNANGNKPELERKMYTCHDCINCDLEGDRKDYCALYEQPDVMQFWRTVPANLPINCAQCPGFELDEA